MREEAVVLLHGLWMNAAVMLVLARRLAGAGFRPVPVDYASVRRGLDAHVAELAGRVVRIDAPRIHFVAHSMGGIVLLSYFAARPAPAGGRAVLLGSPVRGSLAGRALAQRAGWQRLLGESARMWRDIPPLAVPEGREVAAIAGTHRVGIGRFFVALPGANDGAVMVEETRLPGLAAHLVLPVSHTAMLVAPRVARETVSFLRTGRFSDAR